MRETGGISSASGASVFLLGGIKYARLYNSWNLWDGLTVSSGQLGSFPKQPHQKARTMYTREQTQQSIAKMVNARSVAVVGASADPTKYGYLTLSNIIEGGFRGAIYPINPKASEILGLKAYPAIKNLPEVPELIVVLVPAERVPGVLEEAGNMGIPAAVIITGGFREIGRHDLEEEIHTIGRRHSLRFVGPNIQGINYLPNQLNAVFFPTLFVSGKISVVSGSGTVTAAVCGWAEDEGLGVSAAINLGNQTDLCDCDFMEYFAEDSSTNVIALYIEGVRDGKRFLETLSKITPRKNVVIMKGGRTAAGLNSAASHTGALAGSHAVFASACRQHGAVVVSDTETLFDAAKTLALLPPFSGNRVVNISSSGGAGTIACDEAETQGLVIPPLPGELVEELKTAGLSPNATLSNPLDLAAFYADGFEKAATIVDKYGVADCINLNYGDPVPGGVETAKNLRDALRSHIVVTYFGGGQLEKEGRLAMHALGIPVFPTPERAMRGIAAGVQLAEYRRKRGL